MEISKILRTLNKTAGEHHKEIQAWKDDIDTAYYYLRLMEENYDSLDDKEQAEMTRLSNIRSRIEEEIVKAHSIILKTIKEMENGSFFGK